jgi:hypothetical protein
VTPAVGTDRGPVCRRAAPSQLRRPAAQHSALGSRPHPIETVTRVVHRKYCGETGRRLDCCLGGGPRAGDSATRIRVRSPCRIGTTVRRSGPPAAEEVAESVADSVGDAPSPLYVLRIIGWLGHPPSGDRVSLSQGASCAGEPSGERNRRAYVVEIILSSTTGTADAVRLPMIDVGLRTCSPVRRRGDSPTVAEWTEIPSVRATPFLPREPEARGDVRSASGGDRG